MILHMSTYMNPMVITNQKPTIDTQKPKRKEVKHTTRKNHQITTGKTKRRNEQRTTKTTGKQGIKWYIPISNYFKCQ